MSRSVGAVNGSVAIGSSIVNRSGRINYGYSVSVIVLDVKSGHTWPVATTHQDNRRSPGRPPVPMDRIVRTALQIVDADGADALSMRTLAQRLDSGTATLYRHFAGRGELIAHVVDHVFGTIELDIATLSAIPWQDACKVAGHSMFHALRSHPNIAPLLAEVIPTGPHALAVREVLIALLLDNGFPPPLAARTYATLARYILGFAIQLAGKTGDGDDARTARSFHDLDPRAFPATVSVAEHLPVPLDDEFAFGLQLITDGLTQALHNHGEGNHRRRSGVAGSTR